MSDKPVAGIVTLAIVAPLLVLCCAAPLLVGSIGMAIATWLGGVDSLSAAFVGLLSALTVIGVLRWRKRKITAPKLLVKDKQ